MSDYNDPFPHPKLDAAQAIWATLRESLLAVWPLERWCDCGVWIGCSGGADSVALAVALHTLRAEQGSFQRKSSPPRGFLGLVHVNHHLRGPESDGDESFVCQLSGSLGMQFHVEHLDGQTADEASLRKHREAAFSRLAHRTGARYVAVGHTADDGAETLLHNLFRGTGPAGLAGIAPHRPLGADAILVRPLIQTSRQTLRDWLSLRQIPWREDSSNNDTSYTRNWIRHELMPLVESRYPGAADRIAGTSTAQREWRESIESAAAQWLEKAVESTSPLTLRRSVTAPACVITAALQQLWLTRGWPQRDMTKTHWQRLTALFHGDTMNERFQLPGLIDVEATEDRVRLSQAAPLSERRQASS